jgi:dolichyl-phosphate beta-glucosyltransferase
MLRLSIVLPTYEEAELSYSIERLARAAKELTAERAEIVAVDDSHAALQEKLSTWAEEWSAGEGRPLARVIAGPRRGKGAAVKQGALATTGDVVFVMDADLPIPLERMADFMRRIEQGADIVIGERPMTRNTGDPLRFVLSRGLYAFQWAVIFQRTVFADTQCGFKAFRGDVLRRLAARQIVEGGMYDIEYLYVATRERLRVDRVPVVPNPESRPSKINVKRAMVQDPQDLFRVKWRGVTGGYERKSRS